MIADFILTMWYTGEIPVELAEVNILPIYKKKGSFKEWSSYRPIALMNCLLKLIDKLIANKLKLEIIDRGLISEE